MAVGDKRPVLMEADKGVPNGVACLDSSSNLERECQPNAAVEYLKNINPDTTGYSTLLAYMAARYNDHPVVFGSISGFSDLPSEVTAAQAVINLCGGILTVKLNTLTDVWYRTTNSLTSWTYGWKKYTAN